MSYFLGIDLGTSATKALLMAPDGTVVATASAEHPTHSPRPLFSEQQPGQWWQSTVKAVRGVLEIAGLGGGDISAVGLSGQMHGLVVTDGAGEPLRPSIIWNDQRSARQAAQIERAVGGRDRLVELVGNPAMTSFTLTRLLWLRDNEPRTCQRIRHLLLPKDYLRLRLTGEYVGDVSDMSGTLMLDQRRRDWSDEIISTFQIDRDILPPVVESHQVTGQVSRQAARETGLAPGTPVVGGAGDQQAGAVGNGIVASGLCSATLGTSGVVFVHARRYKPDPLGRVNTFCSAVAGEYCMFGCMLSAGGSFQWFRDVLGQEEVRRARREGLDPYQLLTALAAEAPPGCEGLFWLPYLTGERTPYADPDARACWVGIHSRTSRAELARSVLEGATFAMNDALNLLRQAGQRVREIRLSGGGARSEFWRQLQADIYGRACGTINAEQGPAYGAAILAAVGAGHYRNVREACSSAIRVTRTVRPDASARRLYARHYAVYRTLYPALAESFARIAALGE
jgi:xylulokinase